VDTEILFVQLFLPPLVSSGGLLVNFQTLVQSRTDAKHLQLVRGVVIDRDPTPGNEVVVSNPVGQTHAAEAAAHGGQTHRLTCLIFDPFDYLRVG
jgi:hypothetical protein